MEELSCGERTGPHLGLEGSPFEFEEAGRAAEWSRRKVNQAQRNQWSPGGLLHVKLACTHQTSRMFCSEAWVSEQGGRWPY